MTMPPPPGEPVMSYFGFSDPTFIPDKNADGELSWVPPTTATPPTPIDSATPTIPWAWPKLVRVTIGLADPTDLSIEQRFQFVFELPPSPEP
jgi:hypothetical protein